MLGLSLSMADVAIRSPRGPAAPATLAAVIAIAGDSITAANASSSATDGYARRWAMGVNCRPISNFTVGGSPSGNPQLKGKPRSRKIGGRCHARAFRI